MKKFLFIFLILLLPIFFAQATMPTKVLIVPGHDDEVLGAQFGRIKEADMNLKLSLMLYNRLKKDKNFEVYITRDWDGYKKEFTDYFKDNESAIRQFIKDSKDSFDNRTPNSEIGEFEGVQHNDVSENTALKLYGINKWANENNVDAVIHVHFNDYPRPRSWERGDYKGFAIYSPDHQLGNYKSSFQLASFIFQSLLKYYPISNYEKEFSGIVPDQELIAVGANNTLKTRSILIEYGYIYQRIFSTFNKRDAEFKQMANLTHQGLKKYFNYLAKNR